MRNNNAACLSDWRLHWLTVLWKQYSIVFCLGLVGFCHVTEFQFSTFRLQNKIKTENHTSDWNPPKNLLLTLDVWPPIELLKNIIVFFYTLQHNGCYKSITRLKLVSGNRWRFSEITGLNHFTWWMKWNEILCSSCVCHIKVNRGTRCLVEPT